MANPICVQDFPWRVLVYTGWNSSSHSTKKRKPAWEKRLTKSPTARRGRQSPSFQKASLGEQFPGRKIHLLWTHAKSPPARAWRPFRAKCKVPDPAQLASLQLPSLSVQGFAASRTSPCVPWTENGTACCQAWFSTFSAGRTQPSSTGGRLSHPSTPHRIGGGEPSPPAPAPGPGRE